MPRRVIFRRSTLFYSIVQRSAALYGAVAMAKKTPTKVTVLLSDAEFERLDGYCRERGFKKSTLLARLIRQYLDAEGYGVPRDPNRNPFERGPLPR